MPPRRRPLSISANALPASRLPVGSPQLTAPHLLQPSCVIDRASHSPPASIKDHTPEFARKMNRVPGDRVSAGKSVGTEDTPPPNPSNTLPVMSLAELKLQRQKERIKKADKAIRAPPALDRDHQTSHGNRKKVWKPFDFTAETAPRPRRSDRNAVVPEVRISTFRAPSRANSRATSRATSLSRPVSSLSQRATTFAASSSDMERRDSTMADGGFHIITNRKGRRNIEQLDAYEDKHEDKQSTVEATVDEREILNVFGNALPTQESLEQNVGFKNGQLQFVQHPNGDVSCHQWSAPRYIWENIGQFSNIRKKVEGQLAADRLKGETASQTLQQNTLAYFRTIAKQREAYVMNEPFSAKEIQALMPDPPPDKTHLVSKKLSREPSIDASIADTQFNPNLSNPSTSGHTIQIGADQSRASCEESRDSLSLPNFTSREAYPGIFRMTMDARGSQPALSSATRNGTSSENPANLLYDDPFSLASHYRKIYPQSSSNLSTSKPAYNSFGGVVGEVPSQYAAESTSVVSSTWYPPRSSQVVSSNDRAVHHEYEQPVSSATTCTPSEKQARLERRAALRADLYRTIGQAQRRSLSQANFRTVMHDPYRKPATTHAINRTEPMSRDVAPATDWAMTHAVRSTTTPQGPQTQPLASETLVPNKTPQKIENGLEGSSPDRHWSRRQADYVNTPLASMVSLNQPTPQSFTGPFFTDSLDLTGSAKKAPLLDQAKMNPDEELKDWWMHGKTFSRHEDLFASVQTTRHADANRQLHFHGRAGSSAVPLSIAVLDRNLHSQYAAQAHSKHTMTRLLIPVLENLSSYVQGPAERKRDYFARWGKAPEWAIDRSPDGNLSLFDRDWGTPPVRLGRDARFQSRPRSERFAGVESVRFGEFTSPPSNLTVGPGLDRRFAYGARMA